MATAQKQGHATVATAKTLWQVALCLPERFDDLSKPLADWSVLPEGLAYLEAKVLDTPSVRRNGRTRLSTRLCDARGRTARALAYGYFDHLREALRPGATVRLLGTVRYFDQMRVVTIQEIIPVQWQGRLRPHYPGAGDDQDQFRDRACKVLAKASVQAARQVRQRLPAWIPEGALLQSLGCAGWSLEALIEQAHAPASLMYADHTHRTLERIAALIALSTSIPPTTPQPVKAFALTTCASRIAQLPFQPNQEQCAAIEEIVQDLQSTVPAQRLLAADVGFGKSCVFLTAAAALADAGGRTAILVPNQPLVGQTARSIREAWPDLTVLEVTGASGGEISGDAQILVGTTALLHRKLPPINLVVIDEQQKYSRQQREAFPAAHRLEVTATCIPRSQAHAQYGIVKMSRLRQPPFARQIVTEIADPNQKRHVFEHVKATLATGGQVLVVYPLKHKSKATSKRSLNEAALRWRAQFPDVVRVLSGDDDADEKERILADMQRGNARILLSTSVVELGLNLLGLRHVVVVHPEQFGLSALHQIRGRVARAGGAGRCDLFYPDAIKPEQRERLQILVDTNDGFEVARRDLEIRGFGDLARDSARQSGDEPMLLQGRKLTPTLVEEVLPLWDFFRQNEEKREKGHKPILEMA